MNRKYSPEHIEWLRDNIKGCHFKDLTNMFNAKFGMALKVTTIVSLTDRNGLHNGIDCRLNKGHVPTQFKKGHVPANKGKKGVGGWEPTQFRKGNVPPNWVPIGSERITKDGYIQIKVQEGKFQHNWRGKHILVWENENGPLPKGYVIIFGDGNNRNFDIKNLILVSRQQLVRLNQNKMIQKDAELTRTAIVMVDLGQKIYERSKKRK